MKLAPLCLGILSLAPVPAAAQRCRAIHNAEAVGLWVAYGERVTAVEGTLESAERRGDRVMSHLFFEVALMADKPRAHCLTLGWRVEPAGPHPVDAADFDGQLPHGVVMLSDGGDHDDYPEGEIEIWARDDHARERPETFRIVLIDQATGRPLAGRIGIAEAESTNPDRHAPRAALDMRRRLIMTVEDAPEQAQRR